MTAPGIPPHVVKKPTNPWTIIGWIVVVSLFVCGGGCAAVVGITALGAANRPTTTTTTTSTSTTVPAIQGA